MTKPFDTTPKDLVEAAPADWVASFGLSIDPAKIAVIDADVSVVTAEADKVIRVDDDQPWILHMEFQASHETDLARRLSRYNALLQRRHGCPVATVLYLLRQAANAPALTGEFEVVAPIVPAWTFRYSVIRVWEVPVESWLTGGLRLLPFAPIAKVVKDEIPGVIERIRVRLDAEAPEVVKRHLWMATELMMGLKYDADFIEHLLEGIGHMEESTIYQRILERGENRGRSKEIRKFIVLYGTERLGMMPDDLRTVLNSIVDPDRLEHLFDRTMKATLWADVFSGQSTDAIDG